MAKVKYRDQQAIRCDTPEEVDEAYEQMKAEGVEFISEPKDYEWNARCVYFWMRQDICGKYIVGQAQCR